MTTLDQILAATRDRVSRAKERAPVRPLEKAAAAVKAKVLVIVGKEDHTVTPGPAIEFAHLLHADLKVIDDGCGHQYCDSDGVQRAVAEFLEN